VLLPGARVGQYAGKDIVSGCMERIDHRTLTKTAFYERFEIPYIPVILRVSALRLRVNADALQGLADQWPARHKWTVDGYDKGQYRDCLMKCGEDDDGKRRACLVDRTERFPLFRLQRQNQAQIFLAVPAHANGR
jgi:hypothetical protein